MPKTKETKSQKTAAPRAAAPVSRTPGSASKADAAKPERVKALARKRDSAKVAALDEHRENADEQFLTSDQGIRIEDNQNSLRAGERGPSLLEDFHFREKMTHFDHERIPERVVHARGAGAHGVFRVYDSSMAKYTKAGFLTDPSRETPVFVRFSTVAGSRGSTDLARDVRGFATKFYT
ncbi:MAG: catalase, partial [Acidobacteria bacterium]|nr:catalase [Acidobacteriota bacterium]